MTSAKTIRSIDALIAHQLATPNSNLDLVAEQFSVAITATMHQLIDRDNKDDPIKKQFIPHSAELDHHELELQDPIGDSKHSPVKGIVHRYSDRVLLMPVQVCPVYCRFCFRREKVGNNAEALTETEMSRALFYIQNTPTIWEVILTGGDPLIMKSASLIKLLQQISAIQHVGVIRIHSRVPVVDPTRMKSELIDELARLSKPVTIVLHANHPQEFSTESENTIAQIINAGIPMLSQSVLLNGVNDNLTTLQNLMRKFVSLRIQPYYLHHPDLARGTSHFGVSIARGIKLMRELHQTLSGVCQPHYVLDIPGGFCKVPLLSTQVQPHPTKPGYYWLEDDEGIKHLYFDVNATNKPA